MNFLLSEEKMAQLKNSLLVAAVLLLGISSAFATQYMVGDSEGWSSDVDYDVWVDGKKFYVGDVLAFSYVRGDHNVVLVDAAGYEQCSANSNSGVYDTGYDTLSLSFPGDVYFICGYHCDSDQKLKITVLPSSP